MSAVAIAARCSMPRMLRLSQTRVKQARKTRIAEEYLAVGDKISERSEDDAAP